MKHNISLGFIAAFKHIVNHWSLID